MPAGEISKVWSSDTLLPFNDQSHFLSALTAAAAAAATVARSSKSFSQFAGVTLPSNSLLARKTRHIAQGCIAAVS